MHSLHRPNPASATVAAVRLLAVMATATLAHRTVVAGSAATNKFGIGTYWPPVSPTSQNAAASVLVGQGGWVVALVPAGNVTAATPLPPSCPGADVGAAIRDAFARGMDVVVRLEPMYNAHSPTACDQAMPPLRDLSDDTAHRHYTELAASYARLVESLPRPPSGAPLHVQIGNEMNLQWQCSCAPGGDQCLSMDTVAAEVAAFLRDAIAALTAVPGVVVAASPIAPVGPQSRQCCASVSAAAACPGAANNTLTNLDFLGKMLRAVPDLFDAVDFFSSHPYPCAQPGCGLAPAACNRGWNAPFNEARDWLTVYRNETRLVQPNRTTPLPVVVTETGWCLDCTTEKARAEWTVRAFEELWLPDDTVVAVAPFLLVGDNWEPKGFPWMFNNGTLLPVFTAVCELRARTQGVPANCSAVAVAAAGWRAHRDFRPTAAGGQDERKR